MVAEFDLIEFLQMLADRTAGLLSASTVGLLLADPKGQLRFMAASDEATGLIELFQTQGSDGPCLDAFRTGRPVVNADLRTAAPQWPRFAPVAASVGFRSIHAFPLRLRREVIGAMGVFGTDSGDLGDADVQIVQALADVAAIGLLQHRTISHGVALTEQLQGALNSRVVIEQAKGAVAQAHGISVDAAFVMLRAYARSRNQRLGDVAHLAVTDFGRLPGLAAS
ncbi:GAF and ANTAR domain-containing protein [Dactylosporangium matsuzakiense]|nr:GAF and ANTAR domain-containing protein [Dactylosporangium matsuzakiense]